MNAAAKYDPQKVKDAITQFFLQKTEGAEYLDLVEYLNPQFPGIGDEQAWLLSLVGSRVSCKKITRVSVSEGEFQGLYNKKPRGRKQRGDLYSVLVSSEYASSILQKIGPREEKK